MNTKKAEDVVSRLLLNAGGLKYGTVSATLKIHDGRVTEVLYATTESTREPGDKNKRVEL
jgi:hypothetical protein